jgi:hypothetical protein
MEAHQRQISEKQESMLQLLAGLSTTPIGLATPIGGDGPVRSPIGRGNSSPGSRGRVTRKPRSILEGLGPPPPEAVPEVAHEPAHPGQGRTQAPRDAPRGQKLRALRPLAPPKPLGAAVASAARPPEWTEGEALPNVPQKDPRGGIEEDHARSTL